MYKTLKKSLFILLTTLTISCTSQQSWVYRTNDIDIKNTNLQNKTVSVLPFRDKRLNKNKNYLLLYMVPLMPYGWQDLEIPESNNMHMNSGLWLNYNPKTDFAEALAADLDENNIFKEAFFSRRAGNTDYKIIGEIISTKYKGKLYSYGLSVYGPLLHFIGLPASKVENAITVKLSLINNKNNNIIISKKYRSPKREVTSNIYNLKSDFYYSELLKTIYKRFITDIVKEPLKQPKIVK